MLVLACCLAVSKLETYVLNSEDAYHRHHHHHGLHHQHHHHNHRHRDTAAGILSNVAGTVGAGGALPEAETGVASTLQVEEEPEKHMHAQAQGATQGGDGGLGGMLSFGSMTDSLRMPFLDGLLTPPWASSSSTS